MNSAKMKPGAIDRHVAELREHLELMSIQYEFAAGEPVTVPQIIPAADDLIVVPVFAVGDLVTTSGGTVRIVTEVQPGLINTTRVDRDDFKSGFHPSQLTATSYSVQSVVAPESLFREGDKVQFKDPWKELGTRFPSISKYTAVVTTVSDASCGQSADELNLSVTVVYLDRSGRPTNHTMSMTRHRDSLDLA
mgnify:CR=1 FL=1|tara:strand:- start:4875 stop:5450 length:576 start_codon:yes stop_codon:yes gene_type:complete